MLTREHRLTTGSGFAQTIRRGRKAGTRTLVLHLTSPQARETERADGGPAQVGFVVGRAVGSAVTRNLVKRRLRHLVRERLVWLPAEGVLVVRARAAAGTASFAELRADLDAALSRLTGGRTTTGTTR